MLTKKQAEIICEAHEIDTLLENEEEVELLKENNPELLDAYRELVRVSVGGRSK